MKQLEHYTALALHRQTEKQQHKDVCAPIINCIGE